MTLPTLPAAIEGAGIHYAHVAGPGGFRRAGPESPNLGWRNASFRGYADYVQTAEFAQNLASVALTPFAKGDGTAITYPHSGATESGHAENRK